MNIQSAESSLSSGKHLKPIDTLRMISVYFVFADHMTNPGLWGTFKPGPFGVDFFFVLSGFLITHILLVEKDKREGGRPLGAILKSFYIRRTLRIFPLYYLAIFILFFVNIPGFRDLFGFYASYTVNYIFYFTPVDERVLALYHGLPAAHFWSLCVEEQFYLMWPLVVLLLPKNALKFLVIFLFLSIPLIEYYLSDSTSAVYLFIKPSPVGYFYSLGMGAFLAILLFEGWAINVKKLFYMAVCVLVAYVSVLLFCHDLKQVVLFKKYLQPLLHGSIILLSISYTNGFLEAIWNNRFFSYSGKISYGLYVFHFIIINLVAAYCVSHDINFAETAGKFQIPIYIGCTYVCAIVSYELYEKKFLRLKKRFNS
jgi:peptidoglycan/LPS O-acetylase OafA/YrhL